MNVKVVLILPPYLLKERQANKNQGSKFFTRINLFSESEQAYFWDYGTKYEDQF